MEQLGRIFNRGIYVQERNGSNKNALARFKRGHKAGDIVSGIFLKLEPLNPGTAWVNLDGEELLANLPQDLAAAAKELLKALDGASSIHRADLEKRFPFQAGDTCLFVLERLEPEPALQMLPLTRAEGEATVQAVLAKAQSQARWRALTALPAAQLAARYSRSRSQLDALAHKELWLAATMPQREDINLAYAQSFTLMPAQTGVNCFLNANTVARYSEYADFIAKSSSAAELYTDLTLQRCALAASLQVCGVSGLFYAPWLQPALTGVELAIYREPYSGSKYCIMQGALGTGEFIRLNGRIESPASFKTQLLAPGSQDLPAFLLAMADTGTGKRFSGRA